MEGMRRREVPARADRDVRPYEDKVSGEWRKRERGTEDKKGRGRKDGDGKVATNSGGKDGKMRA